MRYILKSFFLIFNLLLQVNTQPGKTIEKGKISEIKIGVMIPININENFKEQVDIGTDIIDAIKFAVDEYNQSSNIKVRLDIRDSKLDSTINAKIANDFAVDKHVISIFGPIFSDEFLAAAKVCNEKNIPIISPTATGNNLAGIGEYVFQANPDFITRAKAMAIYVIKKLKYKNFACFAPNTSYGRVMVENFSKTINRLGGNILAVEHYDNNILQTQKSMFALCNKIFEKGSELYISFTDANANENLQKIIKYGIPKKKLDTMMFKGTEVSIYELFGRDGQNITKKLNLKTILKTKYEVDLPVNSVDAIYIPITSKNDIKLISAALTSYKINAKILGTGDFNHPFELEATKDKMNGLIFDYDSYFDLKDYVYKNFYKNYVLKTKKQVTKNTLYGYDAISILLAGIRKGNLNRKDLKNFLSNIEKWPGLHSRITLRKNRINSDLNILEYRNSKIVKIDEINIHDE
jgi:ABC-type branched-subunit amino acid transport system substrate-binding protein